MIITFFADPTGMAPAAETDTISTKRLNVAIEMLGPLHQPISKPGPRDWLAHHDEPGQTFARYIRSRPVVPQGMRNVLYIQPIGEFSQTQRKIVTLTADYMEQFFALEVRTNKTITLSAIPNTARRTHPQWGDKQILATFQISWVAAGSHHSETSSATSA